jgi:hypothetical protein
MPRRLRGVAAGLLGTFVSRNNDIDGYWALGILRKLAEANGLSEITFDLLPESEGFVPFTAKTEKQYRDWVLTNLVKQGVCRQDVRSVRIFLRFASFEEFPNTVGDTWGSPYVCRTVVELKSGKSYSAVKIGVCASHDKRKEFRSTRVLA